MSVTMIVAAFVTPVMVTGTILWSGGQMNLGDAAASLQTGGGQNPLLQLLLEPPLPGSVCASMTREASDTTATRTLAPRAPYTSFDIIPSP
jgi:hypothetical protein